MILCDRYIVSAPLYAVFLDSFIQYSGFERLIMTDEVAAHDSLSVTPKLRSILVQANRRCSNGVDSTGVEEYAITAARLERTRINLNNMIVVFKQVNDDRGLRKCIDRMMRLPDAELADLIVHENILECIRDIISMTDI